MSGTAGKVDVMKLWPLEGGACPVSLCLPSSLRWSDARCASSALGFGLAHGTCSGQRQIGGSENAEASFMRDHLFSCMLTFSGMGPPYCPSVSGR